MSSGTGVSNQDEKTNRPQGCILGCQHLASLKELAFDIVEGRGRMVCIHSTGIVRCAQREMGQDCSMVVSTISVLVSYMI